METTMTSEATREEGSEGTMQEGQEQMMMPPVLAEKKQMKVLVAIDESEGSFYALKWALDNLFTSNAAASIPDQTQNLGMVVVLHVQQPFQHYIFPAGPAVYATTSVVESVRKAQEQNSGMLLSRALQICKERLIKAQTLIMDGDPKDMICQAAEQIQSDLLVVGSRGLGKLKRAFLGSVSDYCAHHAKCPILIVKPPAK
ncbi:Universal stress protein A [Macleaya cordata]|uniref:Universal stress protein A n=1 Tax=Macleaya cordata TaxID=56857 RepID=A0A200PRL4_MACCD|nr:Universal stress protein A [Macleaya cordata]